MGLPQFNNYPKVEPATYPAITRNPRRLGGPVTIAGTRMPIETLLDYLIDGHSVNEFLTDFPEAVTREEAIAALQQIKEALAQGQLATEIDY